VTLPRGASDQGKQAKAGSSRSPTPGGTHQGRGWGTHQGRDQGTPGGTHPGRDQGTPGGTHPGRLGGPRICCRAVRRPVDIALWNSAAATARGPKSASARPGPCTRPRSADALTRREYHPARQTPGVKVVRPRPPTPASWDAEGRVGGLRALHLDPGLGRMVPMTRVGRSALRAAAPPGKAATARALADRGQASGSVAGPSGGAGRWRSPARRSRPGSGGTGTARTGWRRAGRRRRPAACWRAGRSRLSRRGRFDQGVAEQPRLDGPGWAGQTYTT
jgi:hypothetical protein